ncbi:MAG: hypothetical protein IPL09_07775 [Bacteroidetes bacterium]|nr:hypothetical protein [Bacteroidota bacterium]
MQSAIYYYNEAYDYEIGNKTVLDYSQIDVTSLRPNEFKRIFMAHEVAYKNYREAYINLLFFIESFINAIGYNAILEPNCFTEEQVNRLHGFFIPKRNNYKKYSDIPTKIKDISRIISGVEIDVTISPYMDYIKGVVEIRNKYIHSSPFEAKASLNYTRINWKQKCLLLIESFALELIQKIWMHCYSNKRFPPFVYNGFYLGTFKGYQSKGVTAN